MITSPLRISLVALAIAIVTAIVFFVPPTKIGVFEPGKTVFLLQYRNGSRDEPLQSILDYQTVKFVANRADVVILGGTPEGLNPPFYDWGRRAYDWDRIIELFHHLDPATPILLYSRASRWRPDEVGIAGVTLGDCTDVQPYLLALPGLPASAAGEDPIPALPSSCSVECPEFWWGPSPDSPPNASRNCSRYYFDLTRPDVREYLADRYETALGLTGADGLFFDGHFSNNPRHGPKPFVRYCARVDSLSAVGEASEFCDSFGEGILQLHSYLNDRFPGRVFTFNGGLAYRDDLEKLYGRTTPPYTGSASQEAITEATRLFGVSDGAMIEYFGNHGQYDFSLSVQPFLVDVLREHPNKRIMVVGRHLQNTGDHCGYQTYASDYEWQRYMYASYLLSQTPASSFKHHSTALDAPEPQHRSASLDVYADWQLDLGKPLAEYQAHGDLLVRRFENGLVIVNPHVADSCNTASSGTSSSETYEIPDGMFSAEGTDVTGTIRVRSGSATLLFYERPEFPAVQYPFEALDGLTLVDNAPAGRWTAIRSERLGTRRNSFLRIDAIPREFESHYWEHDILLDGVRSHPLQIRSLLGMRVRTRDPDLRLFLVAEVDDALGAYNYVVVELSRTATEEVKTCIAPDDFGSYPCIVAMAYRAESAPAHRNPYSVRLDPYVHINLDAAPVARRWRGVELVGEEVLSSVARFTFRRWAYMRVAGAVDIDDITISRDPRGLELRQPLIDRELDPNASGPVPKGTSTIQGPQDLAPIGIIPLTGL